MTDAGKRLLRAEHSGAEAAIAWHDEHDRQVATASVAAERARIWSSAIDYSYVVGWPPDEIAALRTIIEGADDAN